MRTRRVRGLIPSSKRLLGGAISFSGDLLAPRRCLVCGRSLQSLPFARAPVLCPRCEDALPRIEGELCGRCGAPLISEEELCLLCRERESPLMSLRALYAYREGALSLVHGLKEAGDRQVALYLAEETLKRGLLSRETTMIVPVPPSRRGRRRRGFDQSILFARALSHLACVPVATLLSRRPGGAQKELDREGRFSSVSAQLRLKKPLLQKVSLNGPALSASRNRGGEVTLLDDVVTTGATLETAAALLTTLGVEVVRAIVIARD